MVGDLLEKLLKSLKLLKVKIFGGTLNKLRKRMGQSCMQMHRPKGNVALTE